MYETDDVLRVVEYGMRECVLCGEECHGHSCHQCAQDDARRWVYPVVDDFTYRDYLE